VSGKTRRIYLDDPYQTSFTATVSDVVDRGGRPAAILDATCFYPEGGGQPADQGTLGPARVLDVQEEAGGTIFHFLDRPLSPGEYPAVLDRSRRIDHMQQHTGQHLLSRCFVEVAGAETVSFHLGAEEVTIDLDRADVSAEEIAGAEDLANRQVLANLPVRAEELEAAAASAMGIDCPEAVSGPVRVVMIGDFDRNACGGTHVRASGEIGTVKVRRFERTRGRTRVFFHCGHRSLEDYAWRHEALRQMAITLTAGERELPDLMSRVLAERRELDRRVKDLEGELARYRAAEEVERAERVGSVRVVRSVIDHPDAARALGTALAGNPDVVGLLGFAVEGRPRLLFVAGEGVPVDLGAVIREVSPVLGGKGGGRPGWAEAGGQDPARLPEALDRALAIVRARLLTGGASRR
jgi:alanyl-tRNA synthetase